MREQPSLALAAHKPIRVGFYQGAASALLSRAAPTAVEHMRREYEGLIFPRNNTLLYKAKQTVVTVNSIAFVFFFLWSKRGGRDAVPNKRRT